MMLVLAGCGGSDSASDTVGDLVEAFSSSDYEDAYDLLHSAHQEVVDETLFADCGRQAEQNSSPVVDEYDITSDRTETRTVPEVGDVEVTIVSVDLTQGGDVDPRIWEVVKDDGEWRWILGEEPLNDFRAGRCPGAAASAQPSTG